MRRSSRGADAASVSQADVASALWPSSCSSAASISRSAAVSSTDAAGGASLALRRNARRNASCAARRSRRTWRSESPISAATTESGCLSISQRSSAACMRATPVRKRPAGARSRQRVRLACTKPRTRSSAPALSASGRPAGGAKHARTSGLRRSSAGSSRLRSRCRDAQYELRVGSARGIARDPRKQNGEHVVGSPAEQSRLHPVVTLHYDARPQHPATGCCGTAPGLSAARRAA